jgi:hypothetical protein
MNTMSPEARISTDLNPNAAEIAAKLAPVLAETAAEHDATDAFVARNFERLK